MSVRHNHSTCPPPNPHPASNGLLGGTDASVLIKTHNQLSVLNRRGYSTGKGKRWNQVRVATARRNHSIVGQKRALPDPERVSLSQAARICGVSHRTIERLVEGDLLKPEQVTPRAPWEI